MSLRMRGSVVIDGHGNVIIYERDSEFQSDVSITNGT